MQPAHQTNLTHAEWHIESAFLPAVGFLVVDPRTCLYSLVSPFGETPFSQMTNSPPVVLAALLDPDIDLHSAANDSARKGPLSIPQKDKRTWSLGMVLGEKEESVRCILRKA
jgi:hypothetical protein